MLSDVDAWHINSAATLRYVYSSTEEAKEFIADSMPKFFDSITPSERAAFQAFLTNKIGQLQRFIRLCKLYDGPSLTASQLSANSGEQRTDSSAPQPTPATNKIFVVHGHDDGLKSEVARFLERLKLEPIILHERPSEGNTVIEKLEKYSDVGFALVLLTPDDVGCAKRNKLELSDLQSRARQNVILEMGYFFGKLQRNRVAAILKGEIEKPSDYAGIIYVSYDNAGAWMYKLCDELMRVGYNVSKNMIQ